MGCAIFQFIGFRLYQEQLLTVENLAFRVFVFTNKNIYDGIKVYLIENKNIERHIAHAIVSWPNPKQWQMGNISDVMVIR